MVTLTFTGTPAEIHSDMREMLNLTKGAAATVPVNAIAEGPQRTRTEVMHRMEEAAGKITPDKSDAIAMTAATLPEPEKKPRTRRTKAEIEAAKAGAASPATDIFATPAATDQPAPVSNGAAPNPKQDVAQPAAPASAAPILNTNKEAVHQALQNVNVHVGLPKAREILTQFKVNRISEIKEDQYKPFIEACNAAVMMA